MDEKIKRKLLMLQLLWGEEGDALVSLFALSAQAGDLCEPWS